MTPIDSERLQLTQFRVFSGNDSPSRRLQLILAISRSRRESSHWNHFSRLVAFVGDWGHFHKNSEKKNSNSVFFFDVHW